MRSIIYSGRYEGDERRILSATLQPHDRLLVVGGGIGVTTLFASKFIQDDASILTYEPNPQIVGLLKENLRHSGKRIRVLDRALDTVPGNIPLFVSPKFWSSSTVRAESSSHAVLVRADAFDTVVNDFKPTYVLIDAEGAEVKLLRSSLLRTVRILCVEVHPRCVGDHAVAEMLIDLFNKGFVMDCSHSFRRTFLLRRTARDNGSEADGAL